jgi:predicted outer membrane repeat protein
MTTARSLAVVLLVLTSQFAIAAPPAGDSAYESNVLDVKFKEGTTVRLRGGRPEDVGNDPAVRSDLQGILRAFAQGAWDRMHSVDESVLDRLRRDGQAHRGKPLPDLNNYFRLSLPPGLTAVHAKEMLRHYDSVEAAYLVPKPVAPPTAPDYSSASQPTYQDYLNAAPAGIDARNAWSRGWSGAGVKVCDVEYGVNRSHVDLPPVTFLGRIPIDQWQDDHGTAVNGIIASKNDGAGTKGIAYGAQLYLSGATTDLGYSVPRPLMECGAALSAGDVVLIEQQFVGPFGGTNYVPTEWSKPVYDAIVTLVANGIVVIETTGNGGQNLDDPAYSTGNDEHWPFLLENDSGAILVTGGQSPHSGAPRSNHWWSNYGATVDLQGWGDAIVATGNGGLYAAEGKNVYYRSDFGGSSGAGPIVVGAVALLQQAHKSLYNAPAPSSLIKHLLVSTGTPQTGAAHLGPLPNLNAALNALQQVYYVDFAAVGANNGTSWANAFKELQEALLVATPGAKILVATGDYWPDWDAIANVYTGSRSATFQLKNGVTILGGYPHGGGARNPDANVTRLRGEIGPPTSRIYHIVTAGAAIDDSAVLDGFTVIGAYANAAYPNDRGGGIMISGGSPVLRQLTIQQNFATIAGGIYNESGSPSLQRVTLDGNSSTNGGGGMWNEGGGPRLTFVTFSNNTSTGEGGGLFSENGSPHIENSTFLSNQGTRGGGLSHWPGGSLVVDSTEFRGNQATTDIGGGIMDWTGKLRLNNVTMSANSAPSAGGGIYLFDANTVTIRNSIFWANTGGSISGALATVSQSIVQGGYTGTGVANADPKFRVPASDLRLKVGSPALDAGDAGTCAATDIRGVFREDICDLGAYEYRGNPGTFWTNGEVDLLHAGESHDSTPNAGTLRQSADDFVVPSGFVCDVNGIRGVLQDGTKIQDAVAKLYSDAGGQPGAELNSWSVKAHCQHNSSLSCDEIADCAVGTTCTTSCAGGYTCENGQCVSACILPGQSLGYRATGKLWEPQFNIPITRLFPGTYWLSIYGTTEPGSTDISYAVSGGDGAIRSNSYRFRQFGFGWVDGGPFAGGPSRDLALDVDAACLVDADGDHSPVPSDCDDTNPNRYPGNAEVCDAIDNDCNGVADPGAAPSGVPTLTLPSRTQLSWTAIAGATAYDVVRGDLSQLRSSGGNFNTAACEMNEVSATTLAISGAAPPAGGLWYLVRPSNSICGGGTYNTTSPKQVQSRDAEIASSASACP